ncbi:MAG: DoxX family protein [Novosphingobium sp.]
MSQATMRKIGIGVTVLVALFWIMDAGMKLAVLPQVAETIAPLGWPGDPATILTLGLIQAICLVLYLVPRTSVLGAILLTAYLGGAIATHARVGSPLPTHTLFGVYVGLLTWGALWLRLPALRALLPCRTTEA